MRSIVCMVVWNKCTLTRETRVGTNNCRCACNSDQFVQKHLFSGLLYKVSVSVSGERQRLKRRFQLQKHYNGPCKNFRCLTLLKQSRAFVCSRIKLCEVHWIRIPCFLLLCPLFVHLLRTRAVDKKCTDNSTFLSMIAVSCWMSMSKMYSALSIFLKMFGSLVADWWYSRFLVL